MALKQVTLNFLKSEERKKVKMGGKNSKLISSSTTHMSAPLNLKL